MLRPLALGGRTPCRLRLRHKHPRCRRLAAARPRLSLTSTRGPARSLADRRGTPLLPTHRSPLSDGALEEDAEDDDARTATAPPRRTATVVEPSVPTVLSTIRSAPPPAWKYSKERHDLVRGVRRAGGGSHDEGSLEERAHASNSVRLPGRILRCARPRVVLPKNMAVLEKVPKGVGLISR